MTTSPKNRPEARISGPNEKAGAENRVERLRIAVQAAGGPGDVAKRSGVPLSTLGGYMAGGEMKLSNVTAIAEAADVRLEWLANGLGPMRPGARGMEEEGSAFSTEGSPAASAASLLIPRYEARACAGIGTTLDPGWAVGKMPFPDDFIRNKLRRDASNLALIECAGDSMEPTLRDGDDLLIDISETDPRSGPVYILRVGGTLLAKRIQPRVDGTVLILSDNPRYPPEVFTPSEATPLDVVGEVVWRSGALRL